MVQDRPRPRFHSVSIMTNLIIKTLILACISRGNVMKYIEGIQVYSLIEVRLKHATTRRDGGNGPGCGVAVRIFTLVQLFNLLSFPMKQLPFLLQLIQYLLSSIWCCRSTNIL